ncbi:MAG TPA: hypothetical protein VGN11_12565, partial [Candidatus Baltobacteraceae bacterium]|nr:hypothetical protein [Candidatus Baltobacteraceae bacterium]
MRTWRRLPWSRTMRRGTDRISERRATSLGGHLEITLGTRMFRADFFRGREPVRYAIARDHVFDEAFARVSDAEFADVTAALEDAVSACYGAEIYAYEPTACAFEIVFAPGRSPFGNGRRVFVDGRLADLMRPDIGNPNVTFEYPVRLDGSPPQPTRLNS